MNKKWLILVFGVAFLVRVVAITNYPPSLSMDEVSIGYNAYSIVKTGRDEWGRWMPLAFKSVGDYKPPVDIYLTAISVYLLGLTELAVRLPVVILGSLTAVAFVYLLREMGLKMFYAIVGGFWLALSPWQIHFSRGSFEAVTSLFLMLLGLVFFYKRRLGMSVVCFSLSAWAYHAERLFVPIFVLGLIMIYWKDLKRLRLKSRQKLILVTTLGLFVIPFVGLTLFTPAIRTRAAATSLLRESGLVDTLHSGKYESVEARIFDNDIYLVLRHFMGKYLNYFDLRFWGWSGLGYVPREFPVGVGLVYISDIGLVLLGLIALRSLRDKKLRKMILLWFLLGPIPAAMTMSEQHLLRALVWMPVFGILFVLGVRFVWERTSKRAGYKIVYLVLLGGSMFYFFDLYFRQYPRFYSEFWQYGYKEIALYACEHQDKYNEVIITDTFGSDGPVNTGIPYAYVLFYCKYDPMKFITNGRKIDKFSFRRIDWKNDKQREKTLMIGSRWDFEGVEIEEANVIKRTKFLNGKEAFIYAETF